MVRQKMESPAKHFHVIHLLFDLTLFTTMQDSSYIRLSEEGLTPIMGVQLAKDLCVVVSKC
jgi:hypothetical protein